MLSDIAQTILSAKAEQHNWPLLSHPKKFKLPTDLFCALPSSADANALQSHVFLTIEERDLIKLQALRLKTSKPAKVNITNGNGNQLPLEPSTPKRRGKENKKPSKRRKHEVKTETPLSERRLSTRAKKVITYANSDSDEDSEELSAEESGSDE